MRIQATSISLLLALIQIVSTQPRAPLALPSKDRLAAMRDRLMAKSRNRGRNAKPPPPPPERILKSSFFSGRRPVPPAPAANDIRPPADKRIIMGPVVVPGSNNVLPSNRASPRQNLNPNRVDIPSLVREAVKKVNDEDDAMRRRFNQGIDTDPVSSPNIEPALFSESPLDATEISRQGRFINWIARLLKFQGSGTSVKSVMAHPEAASHDIHCPYKPPVCEFRQKYRTFDGTCNNMEKPLLGSAFTPFKRETSSEYEMDILKKRDDMPKINGRDNVLLKSPREISLTIHQSSLPRNEDSIWTMEFSLWGQFLAHDVADKAPIKGYNGSMLKCCDQRVPTPDSACMNIMTNPGDRFREFNRNCLELSRSLEVTSLDCNQGKREQLNQASSFIDGSAIYGNSEERSNHLRAFRGGRLAVSEPNELPIMPHGNVQATLHGFAYFGSGDDRANVYAGLIALETVLMREHNRIADELTIINPHWDDERIFQETRRIVIAQVQHITYTDYLKGTVGDANMALFQISPQRAGYFTGYNTSTDPSISNAFAASALRFGHSMIRDTFTKRDRNYVEDGSPFLKMKDIFFKSTVFLKEEDQLMRGFAFDASPKCDRFVSDGLANHLHQTEEGNGFDLAAINIQRNRDHAIPSYNTFRRLHGLSPALQFDTSPLGFTNQTQETVNLFKQVYRHPDDVELWTGGLSEIPVDKSSAVGPLFAKMMAQQFKDLKTGDRFFYENSDPFVRFTFSQLDEIRKIRFSRILCNTMKFDTIQPNVFLVDTHRKNGRVPCSSLKDIDLSKWRD